MSDAKLRELERRWRETKSVDDEAAYLRERVRVGDLTQERLELAAYCGHEGARRAAGYVEPPLAIRPERVLGLERWRKPVCVRFALLVASNVLPSWQEQFPNDSRPADALHAIETWLKSGARRDSKDAIRGPCERSRQATEQVGDLIRRADPLTAKAMQRARLAGGAATAAGGAAHYPRASQSAEAALDTLKNASLVDKSVGETAFLQLASWALSNEINQPPLGGGV